MAKNLTDAEICVLMWEAKMLGKWSPKEGESLRKAYARTYPFSEDKHDYSTND